MGIGSLVDESPFKQKNADWGGRNKAASLRFFLKHILQRSQWDANGIPEHKRVHVFQRHLLQILITDVP